MTPVASMAAAKKKCQMPKISWKNLNMLPPDTPARLSINQYVKPVARPPGRPKTTWFDKMIIDLKNFSDVLLTKNNVVTL